MMFNQEKVIANRAEAFDFVQTAALEAFEVPVIRDRLGETGENVRLALEDSFVINAKRGLTEFPADFATTNKVGIQPVLGAEIGRPSFKLVDTMLPEDLEYLKELSPTWLKYYSKKHHPKRSASVRSYFLEESFNPSADMVTLAIEDSRKDKIRAMFGKSFITMHMKRIRKMPTLAVASIISHEADHVLKLDDLRKDPNMRSFDSPEAYTSAMSGYTTMMERTAYWISAVILDSYEEQPASLNQLRTMLKGLPPQKGGKRLSKLPGRDTIEQIHLNSLSAIALSATYGNENDPSTQDEVTAYQAAGLISISGT